MYSVLDRFDYKKVEMKKVLPLLFLLLLLLPLTLSAQITVVDGPSIETDLATQASTTQYTGTWTASPDIWIPYPDYNKFYLYTLYEVSSGTELATNYYPIFPGGTEVPEVPYTAYITDEEIFGATDGTYTQLIPGETYYLRVIATALRWDPYDWVMVATDESNGVLIEGGEPGPEEPEGGEGTLSLSASPSSLSFAAGQDAQNLVLEISAAGAASIEVTSIREDRRYPLWGDERGITESVNLEVPGGLSESVDRLVTLETLERAKALGAGTEGSFTLTYVVSGQDTWGNPVSATLNVPVAVSGAPASTLNVQGVSLKLPDSPYFRGEAVVGSTITIQATGSGTVLGQVYVDDSLAWSDTPAFAISIGGTTAFEIPGQLPTDQAGLHSVRVELINPEGVSAQAGYEVSAADPPFPPQTLVLIPGVAELTDLAGSALAENVAGAVQYTFSGSATMRLLSLEEAEVPGAVVSDLVVRYAGDVPQGAVIAGGTVEAESAGAQIASFAGDFLHINKISFDWAADPNRLVARAGLHIPRLNTDITLLDDLTVNQDGVDLVSYSWDKANAKTFDAFGVSFRLHDVGADKALTLGEDPAGNRYSFSLSGSIAWNEQQGNDIQQKEIVSFSRLTFFTDGEVEGGITVSEDFDLIPDMLTISEAGIELEDDELAFKLRGEIKNLPSPLDVLNSTFTLAFDTEGNVRSGIVVIDELTLGLRGLSADDDSEWGFGFATLDVTYLGLDLVIQQGTLKRDHSRVLIGADIYLDLLNEDGSNPGAAANRLSFGEIGGESGLSGGLEVRFNGDVIWPSLEGTVNLLSGKSLDLGAVKVSLDNLALEYGSGTFAFLFSGSFRLEVEAVQGGISFVNLRMALNGDVSGPEIQGTDLSIMDFVSVRVDSVDWGSGVISYQEDQTTGEGTNRQPAIGDEPATIEVDSFFEIRGASINIGSGESSVMSGRFDQFLFYTIGGQQTFVLQNAQVEVSGCELTADIKYDRSVLRIAGGVKMQQIEAAAVGKIGVIPDTAYDGTPEPRAGEPTFGLFVLVGGLGIPVAPSVFLDRVGGGVFINPTNEDISTVLLVAGFDRPELDDDIASMRPSGGGDPGSFAVMLLAGVYVAERTLVEGEALITLTANYFSLDAKVTALEGMLRGRSYFLISWNPLYAEGNNVLEADIFDIFTINGDLAFYAYGDDAWGILGGIRVSLLGEDMASGSFFIGPPGFMMEASVKAGMDIGIVSGYIKFSGMVWYYRVPDPDTWGAWAEVKVGGSLLWGLVSASASIEGALIGQGTSVLIYAVGSVSFEVCWIEVFSGSIWVTIDSGGFDGGKGRNERYDSLIDEARNMADQMQSARAELMTALAEAEMSLYQLDEAQRQAAGLALVERAGWAGQVLELSFAAAEVESWPGGLPQELQGIRELIFGPEQASLVQTRTELEQLRESLNQAIEDLSDLQAQVLTRLAQYEQILLEPLPSIRDLSAGGNPFQGMQEATVTVGDSTRTVQVGFQIDEVKAEQQRQEMSSLREGFAGYQDAFIEQAGLLDAKLQQLDEILFQSGLTFASLMQRYNGIYTELVDYIDRFIRFQQDSAAQAQENLEDIQYTFVAEEISGHLFPGSAPTEEVIRELMSWTLVSLSPTQLANWLDLRISLINLFIEAQGGEADYLTNLEFTVADGHVQVIPVDGQPPPESQGGLNPNLLFIESGVELWWNIPNSGWQLSIELSGDRIQSAAASFHEKSEVYQDSWGTATGLSDTVFDRKADLYGLLYEIYDQLAVYGSGMIAVTGAGNAGGISGLPGSGLGFRTSSLSQAIAQESVALPAGVEAPQTPTVGPLRPLIRAGGDGSIPASDEDRRFGGMYGTVGGGLLQNMQLLSLSQVQPMDIVPQIVIPLGGNSGGLPASGVFNRVLDPNTAVGYLDNWIPVSRYFEGKRSEIDPYLQIPTVTDMTGSLTSANPYSAFFGGQFAASHPIAVVEFACKVRAGGSPETWQSLGTDQAVRDAFMYGYDIERNYLFDLRVRGAGGLAIERRGVFDLEYFDPQTHAGSFSSGVDTSDDSPPVEPYVGLADGITANPHELYAEWLSGDIESGIQRYEYAVGTHSVAEGASEEEEEEEEEIGGGGGFYLPDMGSALEGADLLDGLSGQEGIDPGEMVDVLADVVPWTDAGGRTEAIIKNLDLQHGYEYVVSVRATNGVGLRSTTGSSDPVFVDLTPPENIQITEFIQTSVDGYPNSVKFEFSFGEDAETEVAAHYFALGSSEVTDDLFPWTEAVLNFGRIANVPVAAGAPIYLLVKGVNVLGLETVVAAELELDFTDASPPPAPMVVTYPQASSTDGSGLSIGWNEVQDSQSGIVSYAYGISSTALEDPATEPDLLAWVPVELADPPYYIGKRFSGDINDLIIPDEEEEEDGDGEVWIGELADFGYIQVGPQIMGDFLGTDYEVEREDLNLVGRVFAVVKVGNGAGLSAVASSPLIIFDATPPESVSVQAEASQSYLEVIELSLTAMDRESGIQDYRYEIYRVQDSPNMPWMSSGWLAAEAPSEGEMSRTITISGFPAPGLQYNQLYDIRVWVRNRSGLTRAADLVTVQVVPVQGEGEEQYQGELPSAEGQRGDVLDLRKGEQLPGVRRAP